MLTQALAGEQAGQAPGLCYLHTHKHTCTHACTGAVECPHPSYLQLPQELGDLSAVQLLAGLPVGIDHFIHGHVLGCGQRSRLRFHSPCLLPCRALHPSLLPNSSMTELRVMGITHKLARPSTRCWAVRQSQKHTKQDFCLKPLPYHIGSPSWAGHHQVPSNASTRLSGCSSFIFVRNTLTKSTPGVYSWP